MTETVGTATLALRELGRGPKRQCWVIHSKPHVAVRLKRLFARISPGASGELLLLDTPEVARELLWFLDRFPLDVHPRDHLERRAAAHVERESFVAAVLSGRTKPSKVDLALPLRPYQGQAVDLTLGSGYLLLADDLGLGKTACGIGVVADPRARPALVVTMAHLPRQWEAEFASFAPDLRVHVAKSTNPEKDLKRYARKNPLFTPDVYILSYHKLSGWADHLAGQVRSVVFDEAQELRHSDSDKYRAAQHISSGASVRMMLTATPIYNYGGEIFNVLDVMAPDALGTRDEFLREWCRDARSDKPKITDPAAFGTYLRSAGLMLRRTREEVGRELPRLTKVRHEIDADRSEIDRVEDAAAELARVILTQSGESYRGQKMRAAEELSNLVRQATGIAKAIPVAAFVRMLLEGGERVLLFGWHREVYTLWLSRLKDFEPAMYTGSESPAQKAESVRRFTSGETPLLIMSLRSGAGVNGLQGVCRTAVVGELDWSPAVHEQCIGRLLRDGQSEPVVAYFLVADSGSDPIVADVLGLKSQQSDGILSPDADLIERLEVDGQHIRRLAERYLASTGRPVETSTTEGAPAQP